jgi:hypothetical protein
MLTVPGLGADKVLRLQGSRHHLARRTRSSRQEGPHPESKGAGRGAPDQDPAKFGHRQKWRREAAHAPRSGPGRACDGDARRRQPRAAAPDHRRRPAARLRTHRRLLDRGSGSIIRREAAYRVGLRIHLTDRRHFGAATLLFATGSAAHLDGLRALATAEGMRLEPDGLHRGRRPIAASEEDIYRSLGAAPLSQYQG